MDIKIFDQAVNELLGVRTLIINQHTVYQSEFKKLIGKSINETLLEDHLEFGHYVFKRIYCYKTLHIYIGPYSDRMGDNKLKALISILNFNGPSLLASIHEKNKRKDDNIAVYREDLKMLFRLEKSILLNFKNESYDKAQAVVQMVLNYNIEESRNTLKHWKSYFKAFNSILIRVSQKLKVEEEEICDISMYYLERASHVYEVNTLKKLFVKLLRAYYDLNIKSKKLDVSPVVSSAIAYIHENYSKKISTSIVSGAIGINPSHLSRRFKKELGQTVTCYIQTYRIEEAKLLIEQGNLSVTSIASLLGFSDIQYFTTTFKRVMDMTPTQYAKQL